MEQTIATTTKKSLPLVGKPSAPKQQLSDEELERALREHEESEKERLGLINERRQWVDTMTSPHMAKRERDSVTLLIGGLTAAQDFLAEAALRGLGYKVKVFGMPDNEGLQAGKEFGNRGQCNPTYFTVGGLVKYLIDLRDKEGLTSEEIVKNYIFLTAGACGPCRFGMYVTEYRKALRDAGFDGFRVMLFQQQGGLSQATGDDVGLEMNPEFFIGIIKAVVCGDVLNAMGYRIRPYEVVPGATNRAVTEAKKILYKALYERTNIFWALYKARRVMEAVEVDKLRPKAKTSIIGEFWAMTTEGDGNYALQRFVESEGGECDIQLTTAWLLYNIWEVARDTRERMYLRGTDEGKAGLKEFEGELDVAKRLATLRLADWGLRLGFNAFALPAGLFDYHLPDMDLVAEVADRYYSNDLRGGEGHMEVGKLIVNVTHKKAHMTVSVKPFGCMPSSGVSDGVQSVITNRYPGTIFCAVETSGDGATNFYSRVQMYMFKARLAAQEELKKTYEKCGVTEQQVRDFLAKNPKFASTLHHAPHEIDGEGIAGSAACLVREVAPYITMTRTERAVLKAKKTAARASAFAASVPGFVAKARETLTDPETKERIAEDVALVKDLLRGQAMQRFQPLAQKLMGKAIFENNPEVAHLVDPVVEPIAAEE
jgi:predicted nucleotide-binding protein (sugar kinase/HSP70/actin superfamily)